ncbi:MAG: PAS domain S-box protein, partial [Melioribacteraceae bacterium]|nr:PAS domain S-box protein [Melioribacteraceae bacterium]
MSPKKSPQKIDINSDKEKIFNSMIENSPFMILRNKKDATITYVNKAIENFFGIQKKDVIGKKWLSDISKEQKEEIKNYLKEASEKLTTFQHNVSYTLKNNEQKIIQWITQPLLDDNGNFLGELQAIGIDITDKHFYQKQLTEAQDNLSLFFKQSLDGFFIAETDEPIEWNDKCDKEKSLRLFYHDFKITQVNQAFLNQYNAKEKDIIGLAPADFFVHNYNYGLEICKKILDSGYITLVTDERKFDGTPICIEAQY